MYTQEILDTGQRHIVKVGMFNTKENANIRRRKVLRETLPQARYSVQMRQKADQNNSEFGHFLRNEECKYLPF